MNVVNQFFETVPIDEVQPHPRNPRRGNVELIAESIRQNGFYGSLIVQRSSGHILAGSHRWRGAKAAGYTEVPVTWVDVDDDKATDILLVDNRASDVGEYDTDLIAELLAEKVDEGALGATGWTEAALDELLALANTLETDDGGEGDTSSSPSSSTPPSGPSTSGSQPKMPPPGDAETKDIPDEWGVIVTCENEIDQTQLLEELLERGFECSSKGVA